MRNSKLLAALAYIAWVPSLYIVLSEKERAEFVGKHGCQALLLWTYVFVMFFCLRFSINLFWLIIYIPHLELLETLAGAAMYGYAVYCGYRALQGREFVIPH